MDENEIISAAVKLSIKFMIINRNLTMSSITDKYVDDFLKVEFMSKISEDEQYGHS